MITINNYKPHPVIISHHNCVFPIPGGPHTSVTLVTGTPPSNILSIDCEKVTTRLIVSSFVNKSRADFPPILLGKGLVSPGHISYLLAAVWDNISLASEMEISISKTISGVH